MKVCPSCKKEKSLTEFNSQKKYCLQCHRERSKKWRALFPDRNRESQKQYKFNTVIKPEKKRQYHRQYYLSHKRHVVDKARQHKIDITKKVIEYLLCHPCVDCGEFRTLRLSFDHNGSDKEFNVSEGSLRGMSWRRILKEIEKCQVRCFNCHMEKTAQECQSLHWKIVNNKI